MPPSGKKKAYVRRCNSNGEDVAPAVCACYYKAPQRQADNSGGYVLEYIRRGNEKSFLYPLESQAAGVVE